MLNAMIEFFRDLGFVSDARRLGLRAYADYKLQTATRHKRAMDDQKTVSVQNSKAHHRGVDGIGQIMNRMARTFKTELARLYGQDAMKDDVFMKRLAKDNPQFNLKPAYERKARVVR